MKPRDIPDIFDARRVDISYLAKAKRVFFAPN